MPSYARSTQEATTAGEIRFTESGDGWRRGYILQQKVQTAAAEGPLTIKLPPNAYADFVELENETAITFATGTGLGVGTSADPDAITEFGSYTATAAAVVGKMITPAKLSRTADSTVVITSTNSSGTEAGTWAGTLNVLIGFIQHAGHGQSL